jgi:uncharacterized small protein (DUF1192 family)
MTAVLSYVYKTLKINNFDQFLLPDPHKPEELRPKDPITENMDAMQNMPIKAFVFQDHAAHIVTHSEFEENPLIKAHIMEHQAFSYLIDMQQKMGIRLPEEELLQNPQIQNEIAIRAASVTPASPAAETLSPEITQAQVALEDIRSKERIAKLTSETDVYKAQMDFETEKLKMTSEEQIAVFKAEADEKIALLKAEVDLLKTQLKESRGLDPLLALQGMSQDNIGLQP